MYKYQLLRKRLDALFNQPESQLLTGNQIGLEKESLRVNRS